MKCFLLAFVACVMAGSLPPLTPSQRNELQHAKDADPGFDAAFDMLLQNAGGWTDAESDEPIRLHPDFDAMLKNPAGFRGDLCRIEGRIEQVTRLAPPREVTREVFIRDARGRPVLVYVAGTDLGNDQILQEGAQVQLTTRFYKRVSFTARDGVLRSYAAFVGARADLLEPGAGKLPADESASQSAWLMAPVLIMGIVFAALLLYARGRRSSAARAGHLPRSVESPRYLDESAVLPDDPADALAELKSRATAHDPNHPANHAQH